MDSDLRLFRDLILALWDHHEKPWNYSHQEAQKIYGEIGSRFISLGNRSEIEEFLPSEDRVKGGFDKRYVYLNPVTHGTVMVPVFTLKADFGRSIPEIRFQLGLFLRHEEKIRWIGFRFEAPEGLAQGAGRHHYYHIQMIRGLHADISFPLNEHLTWLPDAEPTFPLDVNGSVKLLLSLLVSLYGIKDVITLISKAATGTQLQDYFAEMNCYNVNPIQWYWKVTKGKNAKSEYWRSFKTPSDFAAFITARYAGCTIDGVTKGTFEGVEHHKDY